MLHYYKYCHLLIENNFVKFLEEQCWLLKKCCFVRLQGYISQRMDSMVVNSSSMNSLHLNSRFINVEAYYKAICWHQLIENNLVSRVDFDAANRRAKCHWKNLVSLNFKGFFSLVFYNNVQELNPINRVSEKTLMFSDVAL